MSSHDNDPSTLMRAVTRYRSTFEELIDSRRRGHSKKRRKRLSAKLSRIKRGYFERDGSHHLADTIRDTVFKTLRRR